MQCDNRARTSQSSRMALDTFQKQRRSLPNYFEKYMITPVSATREDPVLFRPIS